MPISRLEGVRMVGLACAVPRRSVSWHEAGGPFTAAEAEKFAQQTGVMRRRVASASQTATDLCISATVALLPAVAWEPDSVDALIVVTQTPDHLLPSCASIAHGKLGLSPRCAAFDVGMGCSGYVYGLWLAASLLKGGGLRRVLLLAGDTISRIASPADKSVALLFGDAGSATALEADPDAPALTFDLGSDGSGAPHLIVPSGGFRDRPNVTNTERVRASDGNIRCGQDLYMSGSSVFTFSIREVTGMVERLWQESGIDDGQISHYVMHQANRFMLQYLCQKLKLPEAKIPLSLGEFGNTSCASIPLTLVHCLSVPLSARSQKMMLAGFGVGWSWAGVVGDFGPLKIPPLVEVGEA